MKFFKLQILIALLALPLMSCDNEIIPPKTEKEIITEISRTWNCDMIEGDFLKNFVITIKSVAGDDSKITITNFNNSGKDKIITATVGTDLIIRFDYETDIQIFKGQGEISNDYSKITWDYTVENSDETITVTGTSTYGGEA